MLGNIIWMKVLKRINKMINQLFMNLKIVNKYKKPCKNKLLR